MKENQTFSKLKKINFIFIVLILILFILIVNLFIPDRQKSQNNFYLKRWWNNIKPQTYVEKKVVNAICPQMINNEKYKTYLYQSAEECKYAGKYRVLLENYNSIRGYIIVGATGNFEECLQKKLAEAPPKKMSVDISCQKTVAGDTWFKIWGKQIIKW